MNIGVFLPNWVGDVAMATPALRAVRGHFGPRTKITGILKPYVADVLSGTPWLDELVNYDHRSRDPRLRSWHVVGELRKRRFDLALLMTNSLRTAVVAWLSGANERIGYAPISAITPSLIKTISPQDHMSEPFNRSVR